MVCACLLRLAMFHAQDIFFIQFSVPWLSSLLQQIIHCMYVLFGCSLSIWTCRRCCCLISFLFSKKSHIAFSPHVTLSWPHVHQWSWVTQERSYGKWVPFILGNHYHLCHQLRMGRVIRSNSSPPFNILYLVSWYEFLTGKPNFEDFKLVTVFPPLRTCKIAEEVPNWNFL